MDDILTEKCSESVETKLTEINGLHPSLSFTIEREVDHRIAFLEMEIANKDGHLSSVWYTKPTDTGLVMNFYALAPKRYKRSVVSGFVHRIYRACSSWEAFHESLEKAKQILNNNQYPPTFYDPIIHETLTKIVQKDITTEDEDQEMDQSDISLRPETIDNTQDNPDIDLNVVVNTIPDKDKFRFFCTVPWESH